MTIPLGVRPKTFFVSGVDLESPVREAGRPTLILTI
jgi:hypothetical protein